MQRTKFIEKKHNIPLTLDIEFCQDNGNVIITIPSSNFRTQKSFTNLDRYLLDTVNRIRSQNQGQSITSRVSKDLFLYLLLRIYLCWHNEVVPQPEEGKVPGSISSKKIDRIDTPSINQGMSVASKRKPKSSGFPFLDTSTTKPVQKPKLSKVERTESWLPFAKRLSEIIQKKKNIKYSKQHLLQWADEIRKLSEIQGIEMERIDKVLDWYDKNMGGEYVPIIESGYSLRLKFMRLEDAMTRVEYGSSNQKKFVIDDGIRYNLCPDGYYRDTYGNLYIE